MIVSVLSILVYCGFVYWLAGVLSSNLYPSKGRGGDFTDCDCCKHYFLFVVWICLDGDYRRLSERVIYCWTWDLCVYSVFTYRCAFCS